MEQDFNNSIYSQSRKKKINELSLQEQLNTFGYWDMHKYPFFPDCYFYCKNNVYYFSGLIASLRIINYQTNTFVCYIGVSKGNYIEIIIKNKKYKKAIGLKGRAYLKNKIENTYDAFISHFY